MLNKIYSVISILIFFLLAKSCISDHIKGVDNKAISNYERMLFDDSKLLATLKPEYKEVTLKVGGARMKSYEFRYEFTVDGMQYEGGHTFDKVPETDKIDVYYLKTDPNFNCLYPQHNLDMEKEKNTSNSDLYWGLGWGVLCFFSAMGFIKELKPRNGTPVEE